MHVNFEKAKEIILGSIKKPPTSLQGSGNVINIVKYFKSSNYLESVGYFR